MKTHYNKIQPNEIFKAWRDWTADFNTSLESCLNKDYIYMEFNGMVFDLTHKIDDRINKVSFGMNGYRIIKTLNYPHLNKKGE